MRRYVPVLVAGSALIAAACSEPIAAPRSPAAAASWVPVVSANVIAEKANMWAIEQAGTFVFTITPNAGEAKIGVYTLNFGDNSVCDPSTSGYGPSEWKKDCSTLSESITITAKFWVENGRTYADFSPDIRFSPSSSVIISARVPELRGLEITDSLRQHYEVGYTRVVDGIRYLIDEAATDPSLATVFGQNEDGTANGALSRKLLHFSGYYVRSGRTCDDLGVCSDGTMDALALDQ